MPADTFPPAVDAAAELVRIAADSPLAVSATIRLEALRRDEGDQLALETTVLATPALIADISAAIARHVPPVT